MDNNPQQLSFKPRRTTEPAGDIIVIQDYWPLTIIAIILIINRVTNQHYQPPLSITNHQCHPWLFTIPTNHVEVTPATSLDHSGGL